MQARLLYILMALVLGALLPVQASVNARLSRTVGSSVVAAFISFAVGTLALFLYLFFTRQIHLQQIPFRN